jgi:uncharacterized protein (DUF1697 family)
MDGNQTVAFFLDGAPTVDALQTISNRTVEEVRRGLREVYAFYPDGMGNSKLRIPGVKNGTARNMNTVAKLAEMASVLIARP